MLTIRADQVKAFRSDAEERFASRMEVHLAEEHPREHEALGEEGVRRLIRKGIDDGHRYGLGTDGATAGLIELMIQLGEDLERTPDRAWAHGILALPHVPGPVKISAIEERLRERTGGRRIAVVPPLKTNL